MFDHMRSKTLLLPALLTVIVGVAGCHTVKSGHDVTATVYDVGPLPRELNKVTLPPYTVEPPDILLIDAVSVIPKQPYPLQVGDVINVSVPGPFADAPILVGDIVGVNVPGAFADAPIAGPFRISSAGKLDLGPRYGSVAVAGLTIGEARAAIITKLKEALQEDSLQVVTVALLETMGQQIDGSFGIGLGGLINLGVRYGSLQVAGLTIEQAQEAILNHMKRFLRKGATPLVTVSLQEVAAKQQIAGEHLVAPDGTVTLGVYGNVRVVGLTLLEVKQRIEAHLGQFLEAPEVAVQMYSYNSKFYYVITQGAGFGDAVVKFPITGNETVLDAVANVSGLGQYSSKQIWVARPGRNEVGEVQILPVNWDAIAQSGGFETNYQVLPGDRVYIAEDKFVAFDTRLGKFLAPIERAMGFSLLGAGTVSRYSGKVLQGGGVQQGGGFGRNGF